MDFGFSQTPTTQIGMRGFCSGRGLIVILSTLKCSPENEYGFPFHNPSMILQPLVETLGPHLDIDGLADPSEAFVVRPGSQTCRENQPSFGKMVYRGAFFSQFPRTPAGHRSNHGAKTNAAGARRDGAHHYPRIEQLNTLDGKAVRQKESIPSGRFRFAHEIQEGVETSGSVKDACIPHLISTEKRPGTSLQGRYCKWISGQGAIVAETDGLTSAWR